MSVDNKKASTAPPRRYSFPTNTYAAAGASLGSIMASMRVIAFNHQPPHPDDWIPVLSDDLTEDQLFEVQKWLWHTAQNEFHLHTHYTPTFRLLVYFENPRDATLFKLSWGGDL